MTKRYFGFFAVAALVVLVAVPLSAQAVRLTANVPFEFSAGNRTLPAGEYSLLSTSTPQILQIRNVAMHAGTVAFTNSVGNGDRAKAGAPRLVFNVYGNHYVLSQVWDGYLGTGYQLPRSRTERELARTASVKRVEIVAMLR
jgi:hypothetical protein